MRTNDDPSGDGLDRLEDRLRASRPTLSPLELDAVQRRVLGAAARSTREGTTMKARIAIIAMLMFGMLFSTAGAGLAVNGFAGGDQASVAQYDDDDGGGVLPGTDEGGQNGGAGDEGGVVDETAADVSPAQQTEFVASEQAGGQLPFTGFAAIPVLLLGIALLGAGALLMRRSGGAGR